MLSSWNSLLFILLATANVRALPPQLGESTPSAIRPQEIAAREEILSGKIIGYSPYSDHEFTLIAEGKRIILDTGPTWWCDVNLYIGEVVTVIGVFQGRKFRASRIIRSSGQVINIYAPKSIQRRKVNLDVAGCSVS